MEIIIDTDCGVDDAMALLLALTSSSCTVKAITCVAGNTTVIDAARNVGHVITVAKKPNIPVFIGAHRPIIGPHHLPEWQGHGKDGFGNTLEFFGQTTVPEQKEHAVQALIRLVNEKPNHYHIIALGPLTNIALALSLDTSFSQKVKTMTIMGGSHLCRGNTTFSSEFNIYSDPEAGNIVFSLFPKTTMISWEATEQGRLSWEWYDQHILNGSSELAIFARRITTHYDRLQRANTEGFLMCDAVAMAALLDPRLISESKEVYGIVELGGLMTRGATVFDWYKKSHKEPNVNLALTIDSNLYRKMFEQALSKF